MESCRHLEQTQANAPGQIELLPRVRELVGYFYRTVKTILLYPPTNPLPAEFRQHLHTKLETFLNETGPLMLHVRGSQFLYDGQTVHEESGGEDNFIATLTRDGVQRLMFLPGLEFEELERFLDIVKRVINERNEDDDLVTFLWEASFIHIRYDAIAELDNIDYNAMEQQLKNRSEDELRATEQIDYSAILAEAAEAQPQVPESGKTQAPETSSTAIRAVDISRIVGDVADISDDLSQVDAYLREAAQFDPARSTVGILFEILIGESEIPEFRETCGLADNLYDRFIQQADFASALRIYEGIVELEQAEREHSPARSARLKESRVRTSDRLRIEQLTRALNANPGCDMEACHGLLSALPLEILPHLVSALGDLEHYPSRKVVCDILAERGVDRIDAIGNGVFDKRWFVVRNVAVVLGNIGGPRACTYLEKIVRFGDERVRKEVAEALVRIDPGESSRILREMLDDPSLDLRLTVLRALARRGDSETGDRVEQFVTDARFRRRQPAEQKEWLTALAHIKGDAALPTFRKLIGTWAFFDRAARLRLRVMAIVALGESGGPETVTYLNKLRTRRNAKIREAAERALNRLRSGQTLV